ncbi:MAG TPA: DUF2089 domain-containing protein [Symbiobacteriaceae bacterium]|nr:DUF2089 domain-containing protein [Symbiobacteriaceae bacterium]
MKIWPMPTNCPVCQSNLVTTKLECSNCQTKVEGQFSPGRFARLTGEQIQFVETFLRARGNIKEVERELGISYPTVRGRLDAIVEVLGDRPAPPPVPEAPPAPKGEGRKEILQRLNQGEISTEEALKLLRGL